MGMGISTTSFVKEGGEPVRSFNIHVADNLAEFVDLWPRTDRCGSAHCHVFQCADFLQVWCDTVGKARGTRAFFVAVFDDSGRPMLLLPLGIEKQRGIRVLRFLDGGLCDYNAPIVFKPTRTWEQDTIERLWRGLLGVLPRFDIAIFDKMPADICGTPNPLMGLEIAPFTESGHFTNMTSSSEAYAPKQSLFKRKSRLQRRRMAKLGEVLFTVAKTPEDRQRIVQAMMRQKSRRCLETGQADELDRPGYRQYYVAMTERFVWPGPLFVAALEVDGKILSTLWAFILHGRFLALVSTFEGGEWKRFSPGRLLLEDVLEWSSSNGITVFDFGLGDESYKLVYSNQTLALHYANIPVTAVGKAYQAGRNTKAWRLVRPVVKRVISKIRW